MVAFRSPGSTLDLGLLAAIVVVGGVLRLAALDTIPTGWIHDEALMGVLAAEVLGGDSRPIFFPQFLGQEPLYIYLAAGVEWLMGGNTDILPLRITSALVGLATIGVAWAMARQMFGRAVGLLTAGFLAFSFWQVMSSRLAFRSVTQPLIEALAVFFLWSGINAERSGRSCRALSFFGLAGIALGGSLYTYLGARSFPLVFVLFGAWMAWRYRRMTRRGVITAVAIVTTTLLTMAPISLYWLTHPGSFTARIQQASILNSAVNGGRPLEMFAENVVKLASTFIFNGEPLWRYNIPGRPIFVGLVALLFVIGLVVLAARAWRRDEASAFILIWLMAMSFPATLSWEVGAFTLRAMGLVPGLFVVPAIGLMASYAWIARRWRRRTKTLRPLAVGTVALILAVELSWTASDYFVVWAPSFGAAFQGEADMLAQARYLAALPEARTGIVYAGSPVLGHATVNHLANDVYSRLRWIDGTQSVVFPANEAQPVIYVFPYSAMPEDVNQLFPPESLIDAAYFSRGISASVAPPPLFLAYRLTPDEMKKQEQRVLSQLPYEKLEVTLGEQISAVAGWSNRRVVPGGSLDVSVVWRVERDAPSDASFTMYVHLLDHEQRAVAQSHGNGYPTSQWRAGDIIVASYEVPIDLAVPAGQYRIEVGVLDQQSGQRLPVSGGAEPAQLAPIRVLAATDMTAQTPEHAIAATFVPGLRLLGYDLKRPRNGEPLKISLYWQADEKLGRDFTVTVQLLDGAGQLVSQSDGQPAGGRLPTTSWEAGEIVADSHELELPSDLREGTYELAVGLYTHPFVKREQLIGGGDLATLNRIQLP